MGIADPLKKKRNGWRLFKLSIGIVFVSVTIGIFTPYSAIPSPSTVVTIGTILGLLVGTFGIGLFFPSLSATARIEIKRVVLAFLVTAAFWSVTTFFYWNRDQSAAIMQIVTVLQFPVIPCVALLVTLYGTPVFSDLKGTAKGTSRIVAIMLASVGLSCAFMLLLVFLRLIFSIILGFPFRSA